MTARNFFTHPLGIIISAVSATLLWGSAIPFIKVSYVELNIGKEDVFAQFVFAGYRFVIAALMIMLFIEIRKKTPSSIGRR